MNKRIRELMELAMVLEDPNSLEGDFGLHRLDEQKFAELLINDCIQAIQNASMNSGDDCELGLQIAENAIQTHFEIDKYDF